MAVKGAGASSKSPVATLLPAPSPELYQAASVLAARAPLPALLGSVRFGAAGWSDASLSRAELFYPKRVKTPEARLRYYAEHFPLVEIDATYYALLSADTVRRWAEWTPPSFHFDAKAHPVFTGHPIERARLPVELARAIPETTAEQRLYPSALPAEIAREIEQRYLVSMAPLLDAGKLSSVLLQFPPWFDATRGNARHLEGLRTRYPNLPFSVEFRHRSWLLPERRQRVVDLLRAQQFTYVVVDEPDVERGGVPNVPLVTSSKLAVLRFHGQNRAAWANPRATVAERFNYLYAPVELTAFAESVRRLANEAQEVHAVFNNCVRNYAIVNAKGLAAVLHEG